MSFFFFNDTATTEIYTLSLHDALPICPDHLRGAGEDLGGHPRGPAPETTYPPCRPVRPRQDDDCRQAGEVLPEERTLRRPRRGGRPPARGVRSAQTARGADQRAVLRGADGEGGREDRQGRREGPRPKRLNIRRLVRVPGPRAVPDRPEL